MLILDFTGIYENAGFDFYKESFPRSLFDESNDRKILDAERISLSDISGTNCICDEYAQKEITDRLGHSAAAVGDHFLRFFDSGNYHYMSRILIEASVEKGAEFDLVVFDHHTDMKWTSYGDILSCGSWILNALGDIKGLDKVCIIGADKKLIEETKEEHPEYEDRVFFLDDVSTVGDICKNRIYISVDKDVLSEDELHTNWDQGDMSLDTLMSSLGFLKEKFSGGIIAVDVCGECAPDEAELYTEKGIEASNKINRTIAEMFK